MGTVKSKESPEMTTRHHVSQATITCEAANSLVQAVLKEGAAQKIPVSVAIMDAGGHLQAFARHDGTAFLTVDIAIDKAWTACSFGQPTHVWNQLVQNPHMAPLASRPHLVAVGGGCPIFAGGQLIGGIGVSGGTYEQDRALAEKALNSLGFEVA